MSGFKFSPSVCLPLDHCWKFQWGSISGEFLVAPSLESQTQAATFCSCCGEGRSEISCPALRCEAGESPANQKWSGPDPRCQHVSSSSAGLNWAFYCLWSQGLFTTAWRKEKERVQKPCLRGKKAFMKWQPCLRSSVLGKEAHFTMSRFKHWIRNVWIYFSALRLFLILSHYDDFWNLVFEACHKVNMSTFYVSLSFIFHRVSQHVAAQTHQYLSPCKF